MRPIRLVSVILALMLLSACNGNALPVSPTAGSIQPTESVIMTQPPDNVAVAAGPSPSATWAKYEECGWRYSNGWQPMPDYANLLTQSLGERSLLTEGLTVTGRGEDCYVGDVFNSFHAQEMNVDIRINSSGQTIDTMGLQAAATIHAIKNGLGCGIPTQVNLTFVNATEAGDWPLSFECKDGLALVEQGTAGEALMNALKKP